MNLAHEMAEDGMPLVAESQEWRILDHDQIPQSGLPDGDLSQPKNIWARIGHSIWRIQLQQGRDLRPHKSA